MSQFDLEKLETANKVMRLILGRGEELVQAPSFHIERNRLYVTYQSYSGLETIEVKLRRPNRDWFVNEKIPYGGIHERAIALLSRWIRGEDCKDIRVWKYWVSPGVNMKPLEIIDILTEAGYPQSSKEGYWD